MNDPMKALRAIEAAMSQIGPCRPDPEDEPEEAELWDGLNAALAALGGEQGRPEEPAWQHQLADALDCFWNAAVGPERDGVSPASAVAIGLAAVANRLRESAPPPPGGKVGG